MRENIKKKKSSMFWTIILKYIYYLFIWCKKNYDILEEV